MRMIIKRLLDIIFALILLILLAPVMGAVWLAISLTMGSPAVFKQRRPGRYGRVFEVLKFRTMTDARDANGYPLPDRERQTFLGLLLRCTSLDELPQMINVLKGEMSFVGPRPLLAHYVANCKPGHLRRYEVRPGITGWAQIQGRKALDYEKRFEFDIWYIDNWSLSLDFKIMFRTILKILKREGVEEIGKPVIGTELAENILPPDQADRLPWANGKREVVTQMLYEREISSRYEQMVAGKSEEAPVPETPQPAVKVSLG